MVKILGIRKTKIWISRTIRNKKLTISLRHSFCIIFMFIFKYFWSDDILIGDKLNNLLKIIINNTYKQKVFIYNYTIYIYSRIIKISETCSTAFQSECFIYYNIKMCNDPAISVSGIR